MQLKTFLSRLLRHIEKSNFSVIAVHDGDTGTKTNSSKEVLDLLLNLDEAHIFVKHNSNDFKSHWIRLVFEGQEYKKEDILDVLCDWSYNQEDNDSFNASLESFMKEFE